MVQTAFCDLSHMFHKQVTNVFHHVLIIRLCKILMCKIFTLEISITKLFLFAQFNDKPKVLLSKYSQTALLHAAHFQRVVIKVRQLACCVNKSHVNVNTISIAEPECEEIQRVVKVISLLEEEGNHSHFAF